MQTCASCIDFDLKRVIKSDKSLDPVWLQEVNYVENFVNSVNNLNVNQPSHYDATIKVNVGKALANRRLLYWAATKKTSNTPLITDAKTAYNRFENHGIAQVNESGIVTFKLDTPQIYSVVQKGKKNSETFFRHMHFVSSNKNNTKWLPQIYTKIVPCHIDYQEVAYHVHHKCAIIINTLPSEYFAKDHIPNSYNLPVKLLRKMSSKEIENWILDVTKIHYPPLHKYLQTKQLRPYELPIITYCAHDKCNASEQASQEFMKKGFVNISEYNGGMKDYRTHNNID